MNYKKSTMKNIVLVFALLLLISCTKNEEEINYPSCFKSDVQSALNAPVRAKKPKIEKLTYKGNTVYIFYPNYYDHAPYGVVDEDCNEICTIGGYGGNENTCGDLNDLVFVETVWEDPR